MGKKDQPSLWNLEPYFAAGVDPKTGLPVKMGSNGCSCITPGDIQRQLRIVDEQNAVNRFTWYNLPDGLTGDLIERILYYRGQGMFFPLKDKFYFLPYALDGTIDVYGRYTAVTPVPFNGSTSADGKEKPWIQGLTFNCAYDIELPEDYINLDGTVNVEKLTEKVEKSCVLLKDYVEQQSQYVLPRQKLNDPLLGIMGECIPLLRTALFNSTGVAGLRVGDQSEYQNAELANRSVNEAAINGKRWVPIIGQLEFQDLAGGEVAKAEEFLLTMQSLDNYRLSLYGLDNGGLFQKKSHMLEAEQEMNGGNVGLILRDSLNMRQKFCNIVNSIWGLGVWCDVSETVLGMDKDGDGTAGENEDQGTNGQSSGTEVEENVE